MSRTNGEAIRQKYRALLSASPITDDELARLIERLSGLHVETRTLKRWRNEETTPPEAAIALLNLRRYITVADLDRAATAISNENREFLED